jgi:hypothetical protein
MPTHRHSAGGARTREDADEDGLAGSRYRRPSVPGPSLPELGQRLLTGHGRFLRNPIAACDQGFDEPVNEHLLIASPE